MKTISRVNANLEKLKFCPIPVDVSKFLEIIEFSFYFICAQCILIYQVTK